MKALTAPEEIELPELVSITPSRHEPWRGAKAPGARFTHRQLARMAALGLDPDAAETVHVRSTATMRECWVPAGTPQPVYVIECPILMRRPKDGHLYVISPAGDSKWVYPDGSISKVRS